MIDEASKRRADFVEGVPIRLENGQEWHFPRPVIELRIGAGADGGYGGMTVKPARVETARRFGERFWSIHARLVEALRSEDSDLVIQAYGAVAADLLTRNYDLSIDDMEDLLVMIPDDEANVSMWRDIADVGIGRSPKPSADS